MDFAQAHALVVQNWDKLQGYADVIEGENALWFIDSDKGDWDVDRERVGIKSDGTFVWAYASGCSCWDGDYEVENIADEPTLKVFSFKHDSMSTAWREAFMAMAATVAPTGAGSQGPGGRPLPESKL